MMQLKKFDPTDIKLRNEEFNHAAQQVRFISVEHKYFVVHFYITEPTHLFIKLLSLVAVQSRFV